MTSLNEKATAYAVEQVFGDNPPVPEVWMTPNKARSDMLEIVGAYEAGFRAGIEDAAKELEKDMYLVLARQIRKLGGES